MRIACEVKNNIENNVWATFPDTLSGSELPAACFIETLTMDVT